MSGHIARLYRHPVKGFTPEALDRADLEVGAPFPCDRLFAIETGPSGFDPASPCFIPKHKFAVLAVLADVAKARTRYDAATGTLWATAPGAADCETRLTEADGRSAFADWLGTWLGPNIRGPLHVLQAPGHRFTDHPQGHVSLVNLASVRDLSVRMAQPIDPLRFRANIYVEGWPAWAELAEGSGEVALGSARAQLFKPITRCAATHVDPVTAERDLDIVRALFNIYGHVHCGIYLQITRAGSIALGDCAQR